MRMMAVALGLALVAGSSSAFAAAHSDYTRSFPLQTLETFEFKNQNRSSRGPLANNDIWANDVRQAFETISGAMVWSTRPMGIPTSTSVST